MRLIFWVTALAVLTIAHAKNTTAKTKPKRQLDNIRTPQNLQYSLVLPHSRVQHFRSLGASRRISNVSPRGGNLPPYAVQMEPVVQYSQKDPLYDPNLENQDESLNRNELYAQPKVINIHGADQAPEGTYTIGPAFGSLPTAPLYSHEPHPHYYEAPEPIIEIIIKESNESLPAPPPQPVPKKKKEPVHVFYVKYSKDPHSNDKVVYERPIPAITPPTNEEEEEEHQDYVTVTPEPSYYVQPQTTTLRAIIKPESEVYHSDSSVKVTFGSEGHPNHYSDRREGNPSNEDQEENAPRPAIAYPQQPLIHPQPTPNHPPLERSARPQFQESGPRPTPNQPGPQNYRHSHPQTQQFAQSRIQFQPPFLNKEQQLPRQNQPVGPFRGPVARQNPFNSAPPTGHSNLQNSLPGPINFANNGPPPFPGPVRQNFPTGPPRPQEVPPFHPRPNGPPPFATRPPFNQPRPAFHSGPQRPFQQPPQAEPFFDEAKYLQENYHTITTDQVDPPKEQLLPVRQPQHFNSFVPKPSGPAPQFQETRPQHIPSTQLLPQQRPHQQFLENAPKGPFSPGPSRPPFFNLKPSPPHAEENRVPFQQHNQFSFHQGVQGLNRPSIQLPLQNHLNQPRFPDSISPSPSPQPIPETHFLPQPTPHSQFNFHPQHSPAPERQNFFHNSPSEQPPNFHHQNPSERPLQTPHPTNFHDQINQQHQQNVGQFVPNGGELVAAIPRYEQHITVNGPTAQSEYNLLSQSSQPTQHIQPTQSPSQLEQQYRKQQQQQHEQNQQRHEQQQLQHQQQHEQQQLQHQQQRQQQQQQQQQQAQQHQQQQQQQQQQQLQIQQQQQYESEQEQVRLQLAQNVQKQQEEIQRLQSQLLLAQQQQQQQQQAKFYNFNQQQVEASSAKPQYSQERSRITYQPSYASSTSSPPYYQSTTRTVEIKPTTQKYVSSTINSINTTPKPHKEEKKQKKPVFELPDEVPDDLRQQLLSSGILDNADISVLDYDKVGDTPLDSLPPDQLANFFSAGGGQQIAASENRPIIVTQDGDAIQSRIDEEDQDDQEFAASENIATYANPEPTKQAVEMKIVHFDPTTMEGDKIAKDYVREDATHLEPVALNDKKYNRYLPLKVSGNQFPLPDVLKGKKVTSVVVLAPVETEALNGDHSRKERATSNNLKGIKFIAGDSLQNLLKYPTKENFEQWLETEKKTATDLQSVVLLVTGTEEPEGDREIFMYDVTSGSVNKLNGELSNAFVDAAENNSLSKNIEKLAIKGDGTPEELIKQDREAEESENVPLLVDLSGLDQNNSNQVSISPGYSKTKHGRSLEE